MPPVPPLGSLMPATRRPATQFNLFNANEPDSATSPPPYVPDGLPPWLERFVHEATHETETLRQNGAAQGAAARTALLTKLVKAARAWLDVELDTSEAAHETGVCEETIRRAVRGGRLPDRRANPNARIRLHRRDLLKLAAATRASYDATADAQSIAQLRRKL